MDKTIVSLCFVFLRNNVHSTSLKLVHRQTELRTKETILRFLYKLVTWFSQ